MNSISLIILKYCILKANVFSHEILIGSTELLAGDNTMGHIYGEFFPNENYFKNIQAEVLKISNSKSPDWQSLELSVQLDNNCFIYCAGGITIDDFKEFQDEPKRIDLAGVDSDIIRELPPG